MCGLWRQFFGRRLWLWIILVLVLGGVVNLGIAWSLALWPQPLPFQADAVISSREGPLWLYTMHTARGAVRVNAQSVSRWAAGRSIPLPVRTPPAWSVLSVPPKDDEAIVRLVEEAFGWPLAAMGCEWLPSGSGSRPMTLSPVHALPLGTPHPHARNMTLAVPLRPLWRGLVFNTLIFAVVIAPVLMVIVVSIRKVLTLRSVRRRKRGRCPRCGYDLQSRFDLGCSECGWNREDVAPAGSNGSNTL